MKAAHPYPTLPVLGHSRLFPINLLRESESRSPAKKGPLLNFGRNVKPMSQGVPRTSHMNHECNIPARPTESPACSEKAQKPAKRPTHTPDRHFYHYVQNRTTTSTFIFKCSKATHFCNHIFTSVAMTPVITHLFLPCAGDMLLSK